MSDFDRGYQQAIERIHDLAGTVVHQSPPLSRTYHDLANLLQKWGPNPTYWERGYVRCPDCARVMESGTVCDHAPARADQGRQP